MNIKMMVSLVSLVAIALLGCGIVDEEEAQAALDIKKQILEIKKVKSKNLKVGAAVGAGPLEIKRAEALLKEKINLIGICCGAEAHHVREMAVAVGKKPIAMKYMPDMSKHFHHGTDKTLKKVNKEIKY